MQCRKKTIVLKKHSINYPKNLRFEVKWKIQYKYIKVIYCLSLALFLCHAFKL